MDHVMFVEDGRGLPYNLSMPAPTRSWWFFIIVRLSIRSLRGSQLSNSTVVVDGEVRLFLDVIGSDDIRNSRLHTDIYVLCPSKKKTVRCVSENEVAKTVGTRRRRPWYSERARWQRQAALGGSGGPSSLRDGMNMTNEHLQGGDGDGWGLNI
ncbi:hypothetical protein C8R44DRAFT_746646 [Mycena epipterygia]|nr:hypothetical protein C8R44DRAFT_746646 [Mycena epipterygia]